MARAKKKKRDFHSGLKGSGIATEKKYGRTLCIGKKKTIHNDKKTMAGSKPELEFEGERKRDQEKRREEKRREEKGAGGGGGGVGLSCSSRISSWTTAAAAPRRRRRRVRRPCSSPDTV